MLQLLLLACIVLKYCTYRKVSLGCDGELNQFSRIWMWLAVHCMFVELSVVLKNNGSWLVAGTQLSCAQRQGRLCLLPAQDSGGDGWSFALSPCRKTARYFLFSFDFCPAESKAFLFLSWITFSATQVCIDVNRKHLLKSSIRHSCLQRSACMLCPASCNSLYTYF